MNTNRINNKNIKRLAIAAGTTAGALFLTAGLVAGIGNNSSNDAEVARVENTPLATVVVDEPVVADAAIEEVAPIVIESVAKVSKPAATKSATTSKKAKRKTAASNDNVVLTAPATSEAAQTAPAPETTVAPAVPNTQAPTASAPASASDPAATNQPAGSTNSTTSVSIPKLNYTNTFSSKIAAVDLTQATTTITAPTACIASLTC